MHKVLICLVIGLLLTACTSPGTGKSGAGIPQITPHPGWTEYTDTRLNIVFQLPEEWQRVERNGAPYQFEGSDGYLFFTDKLLVPAKFFDGNVVDLCRTEVEFVNGKYQGIGQNPPYGEHPQVESIQVDHQPACLTLPSSDQDIHFEKKALLIAEYPPDFSSESGQPRFLTLDADKDHIQSIAATIRFTARENVHGWANV
jgi:hypothetical protein